MGIADPQTNTQGGYVGIAELGSRKYEGSICMTPEEAKQSAANAAAFHTFRNMQVSSFSPAFAILER